LAEKLTLVEPSANLVGALRARFADCPHVEVAGESLETHVARLGANAVDTIVMVNVLEHIEDDRGALRNLFRVLRPGGHLLLFVPAMQMLMSKLDRIHGHYRRYHKRDLITKVSGAGGSVSTCCYFDLPGTVPWLLLNKLMGKTTFNPTLVDINDRIVVPISRMIERVVSPPFGKNLILIACKR
jgi:SAM-dependent methyltransferase